MINSLTPLTPSLYVLRRKDRSNYARHDTLIISSVTPMAVWEQGQVCVPLYENGEALRMQGFNAALAFVKALNEIKEGVVDIESPEASTLSAAIRGLPIETMKELYKVTNIKSLKKGFWARLLKFDF